MFTRKVGHYPPEQPNFTMVNADLPLQQPPMCTGKTLNFPDVLPAVQARKTFPAVESQYSQRNLRETYLKEAKDAKMMSGFTTMD